MRLNLDDLSLAEVVDADPDLKVGDLGGRRMAASS